MTEFESLKYLRGLSPIEVLEKFFDIHSKCLQAQAPDASVAPVSILLSTGSTLSGYIARCEKKDHEVYLTLASSLMENVQLSYVHVSVGSIVSVTISQVKNHLEDLFDRKKIKVGFGEPLSELKIKTGFKGIQNKLTELLGKEVVVDVSLSESDTASEIQRSCATKCIETFNQFTELLSQDDTFREVFASSIQRIHITDGEQYGLAINGGVLSLKLPVTEGQGGVPNAKSLFEQMEELL